MEEYKHVTDRIEEIIKTGDRKAAKESIKLIENLIKLGCEHKHDTTQKLVEDFLNCDTLNYLSDDKLDEVLHWMAAKWTKEECLQWLTKQGLQMHHDGKYNINALILAMNHEYRAHRNFIESTGNVPMTAYLLAKEALLLESYIEATLEMYEHE